MVIPQGSRLRKFRGILASHVLIAVKFHPPKLCSKSNAVRTVKMTLIAGLPWPLEFRRSFSDFAIPPTAAFTEKSIFSGRELRSNVKEQGNGD